MNNTAKQLLEQLGNNSEITIMADVVYGLDYEYKQLQQENKELKEGINKMNEVGHEEIIKIEDYEQYWEKGGTYVLPVEVFNELFCDIEQLQQENKKLKQQLFSPDQIEETCPKCKEKFSINYSREIYDLKHILTELENWLKCQIKQARELDSKEYHEKIILVIKTYKFVLIKLQELRENNNEKI